MMSADIISNETGGNDIESSAMNGGPVMNVESVDDIDDSKKISASFNSSTLEQSPTGNENRQLPLGKTENSDGKVSDVNDACDNPNAPPEEAGCESVPGEDQMKTESSGTENGIAAQSTIETTTNDALESERNGELGKNEKLEESTPSKEGLHDLRESDAEANSSPVLDRQPTPGFEILHSINRTNSFPEVPPLPGSESDETSVKNPGTDALILPDDESNGPGNVQNRDADEDEKQIIEKYGADGQPSAPSNAEARFDEGLPLISHGDQDPEEGADSNSAEQPDDFFGSSGADADDDFFDKISKPTDTQHIHRPSLDRKSTATVVGSMNFASQKEDHEAHLENVDEDGASSSNSDLEPNINGDKDTDGSKKPTTESIWAAALSDDELLEDNAEAAEPSKFFEDDGEGFLEDEGEFGENENSNAHTAHTRATQSQGSVGQRHVSSSDVDRSGKSSQAFPPQQRFTRSATYGSSYSSQTVPASPYTNSSAHQSPYFASAFDQQPTRPAVPKAESFADKSKGGYHSPYDLPMDIRPKHKPSRPHISQMQGGHSNFPAGPHQSHAVPPPPRSNSVGVNHAPPQTSIPTPMTPQSAQVASFPSLSSPPPSNRDGHTVDPATGPPPAAASVRPSLKARASTSSFFEDLPIEAKPRHTFPHVPKSTPQFGDQHPPASHPALAASHMPPPPRRKSSDSYAPLQAQSSGHVPAYNQSSPPRRSSNGYSPYLPQQPIQSSPYNQASPPQTRKPSDPAVRYLPQQPSEINPYSQIPQAASVPQPPIPSTGLSRYSPAPQATPSVAPSRNRYAAPPPRVDSPHRMLQYQPRTSSPLAAHHGKPQATASMSPPSKQLYRNQSLPDQAAGSFNTATDVNARRKSDEVKPMMGSGKPGHIHEYSQPEQYRVHERILPDSASEPSLMSPPHASFQFPRLGSEASQTFVPDGQRQGLDLPIVPPQRAHTQSPSLMSPRGLPPGTQIPYERPASVNDPISPHVANFTSLSERSLRNRLSFSHGYNFLPPTDGREHDPLERWRGCPLIVFGFGGTVVSTFPNRTPRFGAGQVIPTIQCSAGDIRIRAAKDVTPLPEQVTKFPGPLKSKGKKKDILVWMTNRIEKLEKELYNAGFDDAQSNASKRHEEKILLWKVVKILVEHDGVSRGNEKFDRAISECFSPKVAEIDVRRSSFTTGAEIASSSKPDNSKLQGDPINPQAVDALRKFLLLGEREKAVWHAVDNRLWGHAMIISSTLSKDVWKQVIQEFVRQEVKMIGDNTESLSALYEVFAGNWDDSIDELVPPSARAGLQMVSKVSNGGPTKNALDGLNKWKETLSLIMKNRTPEDERALAALGRLLGGYGRIEAAHVCQLFAQFPGRLNGIGGADDPNSQVVLFGASHFQKPVDFLRDTDAILLTEVYEFVASVLSSPPVVPVLPHLQAFKMYHAMILAESGFISEAQDYCDMIADTTKMTSRLSPYYNASLCSTIDDMLARLQRAPRDKDSWIPNSSTVSGKVSKLFNSFVSGDDSAKNSKQQSKDGEGEVGPFAKLTGTPNISPSQSSIDLYGAMMGSSPPKAVGGSTRYAPNGSYTPRTSSESQRKVSSYMPQAPIHQQYPPVESVNGLPLRSVAQPPPMQQPMSMPYSSQAFGPASPPLTQHTQFYVPPQTSIPSPYMSNPYEPMPLNNLTSIVEDHIPTPAESPMPENKPANPSTYQPPSYEPPAFNNGGYQPPVDNSYVPPSDDMHDDDKSSTEEDKPKKKSFMADDDDDKDFEAKAAAILKGKGKENKAAERARHDREADDAVRRAAEEDAKKDAAAKEKKGGWFGGWFNRKDDQPKPIKANLGESSSFYYDPDLKKWVNKKGGEQTPKSTPTPPPPKGTPRAVSWQTQGSPSTSAPPPLPRTVSASGGPPPPPPPVGSPAGPPGSATLRTPSTAASSAGPGSPALPPPTHPPTGLGIHPPPSGPPSRLSTPLSNASSIDDLLGAPAARKGGAARKHKKRTGYVDVMANKTS